MSSKNQILHQKARKVLTDLLAELQPIIDQHTAKIDPATLGFILTNYGKSLKLDLYRDFEQARKSNITSSPFDELLQDLQEMDNGNTPTN